MSQDPIGLAGGNPTLYGYVGDVNAASDVFGLSGSPLVIIGEGQVGVDEATKAMREAGYNAESMMFPKVQWKGGALFEGMSEDAFQSAVDWNKSWLKGKIEQGYTVVDIGSDGRIARSRFYQAELDAIAESRVGRVRLKVLPNGETIQNMRKRVACQ